MWQPKIVEFVVFSPTNPRTLVVVCALLSLYLSNSQANPHASGKFDLPLQRDNLIEEFDQDFSAPLTDCLMGNALLSKVSFAFSRQLSPPAVGGSIGLAIGHSEAWLCRGPPA